MAKLFLTNFFQPVRKQCIQMILKWFTFNIVFSFYDSNWVDFFLKEKKFLHCIFCKRFSRPKSDIESGHRSWNSGIIRCCQKNLVSRNPFHHNIAVELSKPQGFSGAVQRDGKIVIVMTKKGGRVSRALHQVLRTELDLN